MMRLILLGMIMVLAFSYADAQYYRFKNYYEPDLLFEFGAGAGTLHALTDLGGRKGKGSSFIKDFNPGFARPVFSLYFLFFYRNSIGLRFEFSSGSIYAADKILAAHAASTFGRFDCNLSCSTMIRELLLGAEFHPVSKNHDPGADPPAFSPYLVAAAGYLFFEPRGKWNGNWYSLHPLRTEGQGFAEYPGRKMYSLAQPNFALGTGLRWRISEKIISRIEVIHRSLKTDYLDDVSTTYINADLFAKYLDQQSAYMARNLHSRKNERDPSAITREGDQRGNPGNRDSYFSIMIRLGFMPLRGLK